MNKDTAIEYIRAVGHSTETAEYMLKDLSDPFDMGGDDLPDSVHDTIVDGMEEMAQLVMEM